LRNGTAARRLSAMSATRPKIDLARLLQLARDLPAIWNASSTDTRTKQRLIHILVQEIVCELDDCETARDLTPNRLPTVTLVGLTISRLIQCVTARGMGSNFDADRTSDPTPNNICGRDPEVNRVRLGIFPGQPTVPKCWPSRL
jgi:hypothetical protein